jgi:hypothetical protein
MDYVIIVRDEYHSVVRIAVFQDLEKAARVKGELEDEVCNQGFGNKIHVELQKSQKVYSGLQLANEVLETICV